MPRRSPLSILFTFVLPLLGVLCLVAGVAWAFGAGGFKLPAYALIGLGALLFLSIFIRAERANLQYYAHVTLYVMLVSGLCIVAYLFANRYPARLDLTRQQLFSLSDASRDFLEDLDRDVTITVFSATSDGFNRIRELYGNHTGHIEWRFVDPVRNPQAAAELGESINPGDIIVQSGDSTKKLNTLELPREFQFMPLVAENTFTNAIIEVTRETRPKVYFLTGHGEVLFDRPDAPEGTEAPPTLAAFRKALGDRGVDTAQLDLRATGSIPDDASVIVIAGPRQDLFQPEVEALDAWLAAGGKLLTLLDPGVQQTAVGAASTLELTRLETLLHDYGIETPNGIVMDALVMQALGVNPPVYPMLAAFASDHPVTRKLSTSGQSVLQSPCRPIEEGEIPGDMVATTLVSSSPRSWAVSIEELNGQLQIPPVNQLEAKPLGMAVYKQPPPQLPGVNTPDEAANNTRIVVYGSSALIQDHQLQNNNLVIMLMFNTIDWLAESNETLNIPPRQPEGTPIVLTAGQSRLVFMLTVILLPGVLFFGGVSYTVLRRRR